MISMIKNFQTQNFLIKTLMHVQASHKNFENHPIWLMQIKIDYKSPNWRETNPYLQKINESII